MAKYVIDFSLVAPHFKGELVEFEDKAKEEIKALVKMGAIHKASDEEAKGDAVPFGSPGVNGPMAIPPVPFAPTDPEKK